MREFESGATRDDDEGKPSYIGYDSPLVVESYGRYMLKHQRQANGEMRGAGNWKLGMSRDVYIESLYRHLLDLWMEHEGYPSRDGVEEALNGIIFNAKGYLFEHLKGEGVMFHCPADHGESTCGVATPNESVDVVERVEPYDMARGCHTCRYEILKGIEARCRGCVWRGNGFVPRLHDGWEPLP